MSANFASLEIMLVDDNKHMRKLLETILTAFGCTRFIHAEDGEAAWSLLQKRKPDIVFMDIEMEGMGGIALARLVRTHRKSANPMVPIIMVSGYSSLDRVTEARNAGVNEFLVKPIATKSVFVRIQSVIERPRPFVRTANYFGPDRRRMKIKDFAGEERRESEMPQVVAADSVFI